MRRCCINECSSCERDPERHLFEYCDNVFVENFKIINKFTKIINKIIIKTRIIMIEYYPCLFLFWCFRINNGRKEWINVIKMHQPLNEIDGLYVCDLHFDPENIQKHKTKVTLRRNARLNIGYVLNYFNSKFFKVPKKFKILPSWILDCINKLTYSLLIYNLRQSLALY